MSKLYFSLSKEALMPREELLDVKSSRRELKIGVVSEVDVCEDRVALTPDAVHELVKDGHFVYVEKQAGDGANFSNLQYSEAGAYIVERAEAYSADIIFKINPPTMEDIDMLNGRQLVFSYLSPYHLSQDYLRRLSSKQITAIALENIKDSRGHYPFVRINSEIAGIVAVQVVSELFCKSSGGRGLLLGGISGVLPAELVVIGSGTAAEFVVRSATGLGASVKLFDNSVQRLQSLQQNLGGRIDTSVMRPQVLEKALSSADALICAAFIDGYNSKWLISEEMVMRMKNGSVIVDLGINGGGCCQTSQLRTLAAPTFIKHGVIHYCVPNINSRAPYTASMAVSNILVDTILNMGRYGSLAAWLKAEADMRNGVYMYNGILTNHDICSHFGLPSQDIHLLMAAF